jgi:hypothetical protein
MNWYTLKFLPNNPIIKYMGIWLFLVPIIAEIQTHIQLFKPFPWVFLFGAALAFTVANIVYLLRCPSIIKDHIVFTGFWGDLKINAHLQEYADSIGFKDAEIPTKNDQDSLRIAFWKIHIKAKTSRLISLWICFGLYLLGFLFLSITLYLKACSVWELLQSFF